MYCCGQMCWVHVWRFHCWPFTTAVACISRCTSASSRAIELLASSHFWMAGSSILQLACRWLPKVHHSSSKISVSQSTRVLLHAVVRVFQLTKHFEGIHVVSFKQAGYTCGRLTNVVGLVNTSDEVCHAIKFCVLTHAMMWLISCCPFIRTNSGTRLYALEYWWNFVSFCCMIWSYKEPWENSPSFICIMSRVLKAACIRRLFNRLCVAF